MSLQLGRHGVVAVPREDELASLAGVFGRHHAVRLPGFLDPEVAALLRSRLPLARFEPRLDADGVEVEQTLADETLAGLFVIMLNDPRLFGVIEQVTGCGGIGCFTGRIYRRGDRGGAGHYYPWHDDVSDDRLVGLSLNLSAGSFSGGLLQIREAQSHRVLTEIANPQHGDAMLFRIAEQLEHQVTPVQGGEARTVLAGWFRSSPSFSGLLKDELRRLKSLPPVR